MSAFLVSQRGLTMLADGVDDAINKGKVANFPVECEMLSEIFKDDWLEGIFYDLNYLNAYALRERYGDNIESNLYEDLSDIPEYTIDEYLKMLDCFLYQCSEGDTVKQKLFIALEELEKSISQYVDRKTSLLYKEASWG